MSTMLYLSDVIKTDTDVQWSLTVTRFKEWMTNNVFHFKWWLLLIIFIISVFIFRKLVDKTRLNELILYAAMVSVIILALDELGEELTLWDYPIELLPLFPPIYSIDLASLPFVYALIYQHFSSWKSFTIACAIMSALACFVLEPFFVLSGIYQMITWKAYYGLPLYFAIGICAKAIMAKMERMEAKRQNKA